MKASGGKSLGATVGRVVALVLNGLAVVWVLAVAVSIMADRPRTITLIIIAIQAIVALGIQTWVFWCIATGWVVFSNARRVGLTLLGVIVAPTVLAVGIVGAAAAVFIWRVLVVLRSGADRSVRARSRPHRSLAGETVGPGTGWAFPESTRKKCSLCVDGKQPCSPCGRTGYRYADGAAIGFCFVCGGSGGVTCGNCGGNGFTN